MRFVAVAVVLFLSLSAQAATLFCDLSKAPQSELTEPMYQQPVEFEQRQVTGIFLELGQIQWGSDPVLNKVTVVYQQRAARSLKEEKAYEQVAVNKSLKERVDVPFFADYYSREVRLMWNPVSRIEWNENGTFQAVVPGWQLYVEAHDPYHQESYEASIDCAPAKRK